jgi:hypothetical protein
MEYMPMLAKRCDKCGFLAVRDSAARKLVEVDDVGRSRWEFPASEIKMGTGNVVIEVPAYDEVPICSVGAMDITAEAGNSPAPSAILTVIQKDRPDCEGFFSWHPEFSPKEHQTMWIAEQLQKEQARQRERDQQFQEKQAAANRSWQFKLALFAAGFAILNAILGWALAIAGKYLF